MTLRRIVLFLLVVFCLTLAFDSNPAAYASTTTAQQAEAAWAKRDQPGETLRAIELWKKALAETPSESQWLIRLSMACGRAYRHAETPSERKRWASDARSYAETAVAQNPKDAWAYTAYGEALGQWAEAHKGIRSLKAVKKAIQVLNKAIALDPSQYYAHMLLSQFYTQAPRLFSIGDKEKGLQEARLSVQHGPGYAITHLSLARSLKAIGRIEEAITEYKKILELTPPPDAIPETLANQQDARDELRAMGVSLLNASVGNQSNCQSQSNQSLAGTACHE